MTLLPKDAFGCPALLLAPMEGVGDLAFRRAMASIGGFDEACTEFLRVPMNAHVPSLARRYDPGETHPIPQAVQLMGSNPELMAAMTREVVRLGAHRVDLNCGCPSNTVTGKGAGSSLLKDPNLLHHVAKAMVDAVDVPVTAKLRIGFEDTTLFRENMLAVQESGVEFITLHARTKADGYGPPARWEFITEAKNLLRIPVVGNGDILNAQDAVRMLETTGCDALMIGRGAVINPFIFLEIRSFFSKKHFSRSWSGIELFFRVFMENIPMEMPARNQVNKLKQLLGFLFKANDQLLEERRKILCMTFDDAPSIYREILRALEEHGDFE
jgi:tRNA-dihydrouridine synthase C